MANFVICRDQYVMTISQGEKLIGLLSNIFRGDADKNSYSFLHNPSMFSLKGFSSYHDNFM